MKIFRYWGAAVLAASTLSGCATITRGTHEKFNIRSQPSGADVSLTNGLRCTTPCHLNLRRKEEFVATVTLPGYKPAQISVESKMHGGGGAALAGNLVAGGIIGGAIDGTNGSLRDLKPNPIDVTLVQETVPGPVVTPSATPVAAADPASTIQPAIAPAAR